jgi:hypothetical protein
MKELRLDDGQQYSKTYVFTYPHDISFADIDIDQKTEILQQSNLGICP